MKKKLLTLLLMVGLVICFLPFSAEAAGTSTKNATSITSGQEVSGTLKQGSTSHYYKVVLSKPSRIRVDISNNSSSNSLNLRIKDSNDNYVTGTNEYSYYVGKGTQEMFNLDLLPGTYYMNPGVNSIYGTNTIPYSFTATITAATVSAEDNGSKNNSISKASNISVNKVYKGQLALNDLHDYYKFTITTNSVIRISVNGQKYQYYRIYKKDGTEIKYFITDGGAQTLSAYNLGKGTYYLDVTCDKSRTGNYKFKIVRTNVGWNKVGKNYYYQDKFGNKYKKRWLDVGKKRYYLNASGYRVTGFKKLKDDYYLFNKNGVMLTGWRTYNKKRYYFNKTLGYAYTGERLIGNDWYYFNKKGQMQKGWIKQDGYYYYYGSNGAQVHGWAKIGGKWYWFYNSGRMYSNGYRYEGSKKYYFNKSGVCTNR